MEKERIEADFIFQQGHDFRIYFCLSMRVERCPLMYFPPRECDGKMVVVTSQAIWEIMTPEGEYLELKVMLPDWSESNSEPCLRSARAYVSEFLCGWRGERGRGNHQQSIICAWETYE